MTRPVAAPGWLRRNRWGLVALLPALVAAFALPVQNLYDAYRDAEPRRPVSAGPSAWTDYGAAKVRLVRIEAATDVLATNGKGYTPPEGTKVWRAVVELQAADPMEALAGCRVRLEDGPGRTYEERPAELGGTRLTSPGCTPPAEGNVTGPYEARFHFLLPDGAVPVALRLWIGTELPAYARLTTA